MALSPRTAFLPSIIFSSLHHLLSPSPISTLVFLILANFLLPLAHPLSFNITRFVDPTTDRVLLEGDGRILSSGVVDLNTAYYFRVGRVVSSEPLQLWDSATGAQADFTTRFSFTIDTSDRVGPMGDGLAFFLAPVGFAVPPNSAGGGFGVYNGTTDPLVMVEFDTYPDRVAAEQHVGINRNSFTSLVYGSWNASAYTGKPANVWISYNSTTKNLSVSWTYDQEKNSIPNYNLSTSSLSYILNLKEVLPERVTVGFTAATGLYYERHIINSWEFSSNLDVKNWTVVGRDRKGTSKKLLALILVLTCFFVLAMGGIGICIWLVLKRTKANDLALMTVKEDLERASLPMRFSYRQLVAATNGFADDRRLGRGGSGQVYRGTLKDLGGRTVAVKRIFGESESSERIFINEVKIISRLIHRNLVQFVGWCREQNEFLLVYEYMPNGSLDMHLFRNGNILPWDTRYKIALGLASALHYLHEDAEKCVIHRDIKSANILLDTDFSTKLGDFGVAKLVDTRMRTQRTALVGTYGYLAPEYVSEGRATKESDMYSFGVVALELACGRRTFVDEELDHVPLMRWVWELHLAGKIMEAVDERLGVEFDEDEMRRLLMVGLWCSHPRRKERPKAEQVIKVLRLEAQVPELPHDTHNNDNTVQVIQYSPSRRVSDSLHQLTAISSSFTNVGR